MNRNTLRLLVFVVAVLLAALFLIESGDDGDLPGAGTPLLPEMREFANDIDTITVTRAGQAPLSIVKKDSTWVVPDRGEYPADIARIREVLLAMTEATVVEAKTANPELHSRLGVDTPDNETSKAVLISASAGDRSFDMIFGNVAQQNFRYARVADVEQSWLIDQNPEIPEDAGAWLRADIIDLDADRVKSVTINHPDGETISIGKESEEDSNFSVADVPEGRELSYSTVANGIGGALNDLDLDDVRPAVAADGAVVTRFETFDGVRINAEVFEDDGGKWVALSVHLPADVVIENADEWQATADRVGGWQYRIADYKANLLTRRWDDILKSKETDEE
jgi:hypothetical protein